MPIQNKIYLFSQMHGIDYKFIYYESSPYSKDLAKFIKDIHPKFSEDISSIELDANKKEDITKIMNLAKTALGIMIGSKEIYRLLSTMLFINNNSYICSFWQYKGA